MIVLRNVLNILVYLELHLKRLRMPLSKFMQLSSTRKTNCMTT